MPAPTGRNRPAATNGACEGVRRHRLAPAGAARVPRPAFDLTVAWSLECHRTDCRACARDAKMDGMVSLSETYWELQGDENPIGLEEFVGRAAAGAYGSVTKVELCAFLHEVEARLVHQIEHGEGGAHDEAAREELIDETHNWIEDLITRFC